MTRPDIAETAGKLAQINARLGSRHHTAVNRAIRYAYSTRFLALEFGRLPHEFNHPNGLASAGPTGPVGPGHTSVQAACNPSDVSLFILNTADTSHTNNPNHRS